jgi:hypothetical protein
MPILSYTRNLCTGPGRLFKWNKNSLGPPLKDQFSTSFTAETPATGLKDTRAETHSHALELLLEKPYKNIPTWKPVVWYKIRAFQLKHDPRYVENHISIRRKMIVHIRGCCPQSGSQIHVGTWSPRVLWTRLMNYWRFEGQPPLCSASRNLLMGGQTISSKPYRIHTISRHNLLKPIRHCSWYHDFPLSSAFWKDNECCKMAAIAHWRSEKKKSILGKEE